jgi:sporulation protein YlmC with PRC-barrel domain
MKLHLLLTLLVTTAVFITAQDRDASAPDSANAGANRADAATAGGANPNGAEPAPASPSTGSDAGGKKTSVTEGSRLTDENTVRAAEHRRASEIIGMDIMNMQDEKIGAVDDLAVDLSSGRIAAVIISSGGFLGIANELSIVPPATLTLTDDNKAFSANLTKDQLTNAPRFQGSEYPDLDDQKYMLNVYSAYQAESYLDNTRADTTVDGARRVMKASEILGMDVKNHQDETIGDINELILNRALNRVTSVVVSSGGFLGIGNTLSVLPVEAVTPAVDAVLVNATKETLERSPRLAENEWPERMNDPSYLVDVYEPYQFSTNYQSNTDADVSASVDSPKIDADRKAEAGTAAGRDQDKDPDKLTAQDQSNAPGDLDATAKIRRKIVSRDDLSFAAKNIRVITVDGKVTLAGQVTDEREMETILKVARDEMGGAAITNKLSVKD